MPKATDEEREEYIKQRLMEQQPANDWKLDIVPETLILTGLLFAFLQPVMGVVLILHGCIYGVIALSITAATFYFLIMYLME